MEKGGASKDLSYGRLFRQSGVKVLSYDLVTEKKDGYLLITVSGIRSFESVLSISEDILSACKKENIGKVLLDIRALKGRLEMFEAYTIPDQHFPRLKDMDALERCAIIDHEEAKKRFSFFENVAVNRGFFLRFFTSLDAANEWLRH